MLTDQEIGHWLVNVPYFWVQDPRAELGHSRVYITAGVLAFKGNDEGRVHVPSPLGVEVYEISLVQKTCPLISPLLQFLDATGGPLRGPFTIRVNGRDIYAPKRVMDRFLSDDFSSSIDYFSRLYDYPIFMIPTKIKARLRQKIPRLEDRTVKSIRMPSVRPSSPSLKDSRNTIGEIWWSLNVMSACGDTCVPIDYKHLYKFNTYNDIAWASDVRFVRRSSTESEFIIRPGMVRALTQCLRMVKEGIIPLSIGFYKPEGAHQALLFFDKKRKNIEWYDPHGLSLWPEAKEKILFGLKEKIPALFEWEILTPNQICPYIHFQRLEEAGVYDNYGFCYFWSMLVASVRIRHPELTAKSVMRSMLHSLAKKTSQFRDFIVQYAKGVQKYIKEVDKKFKIKYDSDEKMRIVSMDREAWMQEVVNYQVQYNQFLSSPNSNKCPPVFPPSMTRSELAKITQISQDFI